MQVKHVAAVLLLARVAAADEASVTASTEPAKPDDLQVRLTVSSFFYRQSGSDPGPLVAEGAQPQNASPVRRFFGDPRMELTDAGLEVDARVRQTTSERFQSGADGGGEYEVRTLAYRLGPARIGRQFIDAVGATKIDGASATVHVTPATSAVAFAGAFPVLGSRSIDTDYLRQTDGSLLIPLTGGVGVAYQTASVHGDVGGAAVYGDNTTRVFTTTSGYWRSGGAFDAYHFVMLDVAPSVNLTNGSLGIDARPADNILLTASVNHVSTDLLEIAARNLLADPDPTAIGIVQNNINLLRVSQDMARAGASLALAERRFELSISGGVHRRPSVSVPTADGGTAVVFPESRSADATFGIVDRHSIADTRVALTGSLTQPLGDASPNRSRGIVLRAAISTLFADMKGQVEGDVMYEHMRDTGSTTCMVSTNPLACFGSSATTAAQAGVLASWRVAREWLLIADAHAGYQDVTSQHLTDMPLAWPRAFSVTAFARVQWRYR